MPYSTDTNMKTVFSETQSCYVVQGWQLSLIWRAKAKKTENPVLPARLTQNFHFGRFLNFGFSRQAILKSWQPWVV